MTPVRVRFAPSPTGYLHIGGARTALYNWLFARRQGGVFLLRIEDTDVERSTAASLEEILEGLRWLGLDWDEGPYYQSHYRHEHQQAAQRLLASGHAYKCFCTPEELQQKRLLAEKHKTSYHYDRTCRGLRPEEIASRESRQIPHVIRFKVPDPKQTPDPGVQAYPYVGFDDIVYGKIEKSLVDIEDFVIVRSDGMPLYLLSNAVDDLRDRITHVIRGQDGLANTPRQILIYRALGTTPPRFAHMNLTLDPQRAKISKRKHGEVVTVSFYRERGFLPWALCNFLLLLGWSAEDNREILSREEAIREFTLERIGKPNSVFNYNKDDPKFFTDPKALSINAHYIRTLDLEELGRLVARELEEAGLWRPEYEREGKQAYLAMLDMIRARFHTLKDFLAEGRAYFSDDFPITETALEKNLRKEPRLREWLPELAGRLERLAPFDLATTEAAVRSFSEEKQVKAGVLINAIRAAVTGQIKGPGLFEILVTLGPRSTALRLSRAAAFI
ncbi:MAG: glutamate--tRNA ligase [bacterium]